MDDDIYEVTASDVLKLLDANKDVIGGVMHASGFPYAMCAFRRYDVNTRVSDQPILKGPCRLYEVPVDQRVGIQKVDLIPFAFTLIKVDVFRKLPKPWFNGDGKCPTDSWFADTVLNANMEYFVHFDVWLNHRGITRYTQPLWAQIGLINAQQKQGQNVIVLTPEEMQRHEAFMRVRLEEAEQKAKAEAFKKLPFFDKEGEFVAKKIEVPKEVNNAELRKTALPVVATPAIGIGA